MADLEAIGPREAVRGRVRDHPRQAVHPLGRRIRMKPPRPARLEDLVTDLKPDSPSSARPETSTPTPNHRQLELDLVATPDSPPTDAPAPEIVDPPETPEPTEPPVISTNPVTSRRWAMTWKPDAEATDRTSQHPAARVARENVDAAINQPSIPAIQSPNPGVAPTDRTETLVTDDEPEDEPGDELGETAMTATLTPEPEATSAPASDATLETEPPSTGDAAADPQPIADETPTPVIEPATPATTEPAESDEPDASDGATETAAAPSVDPSMGSTTERMPADVPMPAPSASNAVRATAAGWIVAALIGLGWLIASNQPAEQPGNQATTPPPPAATAATAAPADPSIDADAETILGLEAAITDLQATSASASARISTLEGELEDVRSDAAYLNRERSLLQAELEGLMELIEPPATATNDPSAGG